MGLFRVALQERFPLAFKLFLLLLNCNHACDRCPGPVAVSVLSYAAVAVTASPTYDSNMECLVTIVGGAHGGVPALNFTSFATEGDFDFLWLYDGDSTSAPLLGRYSGTQVTQHVNLMIAGASGAHFAFTSQVAVEFVASPILLDN